MLERLRLTLQAHGFLSRLVIDETETLPSSSAYRTRFGTLLRAYQMVEFTPDRDYRYIEINKELRALHPELIAHAISGIRDVGGTIIENENTGLLAVNGEFTASIVVVRCTETNAGSSRWNIRLDVGLRPDITIAVRMDRTNKSPLDYYLLPTLDMSVSCLRLAQSNGLSLDAYRFDTLGHLFKMAERQSVAGAA